MLLVPVLPQRPRSAPAPNGFRLGCWVGPGARLLLTPLPQVPKGLALLPFGVQEELQQALVVEGLVVVLHRHIRRRLCCLR